MGHCEDGFGTKVCIVPGVTVSDNYDRMQNNPRINGIELKGNRTAKDLNLLSRQEKNYTEVTERTAQSGSFLLLLSENGQVNKLRLGETFKGKFYTVKKIPDNLEPGSYVFLLIGG